MFKVLVATILVVTSLVAQLNLKKNSAVLDVFMKSFPTHTASIILPLMQVIFFSGISLFANWWAYRYLSFLEMVSIQSSYIIIAALTSQIFLHEQMPGFKLFLGISAISLTIIFTVI